MSKHLILGDVHLGKSLALGRPGDNGKPNSRVQDQLDLLDWVRDYCVKNEINTIFITGDIYQDPRPHHGLINYFMKWLVSCGEEDIFVHIVAGNHDMLRSGAYMTSALDIINTVEMPNARFYKHPENIEVDGIVYTLSPFRDKRFYEEKGQDPLKGYLYEFDITDTKLPKVMIGHVSLAGAIQVGDEISSEINELFVDPEDLNHWDYIWMGHIHNPQVINKSAPYAAHTGSMDRSDFDAKEILNDKIVIVIDPGSESFFKHEVLPTRPLVHTNVSVPPGKDSTEYVINSIAVESKHENYENAIVRIDITLQGAEVANVDRAKVEEFVYKKLKSHYICGFSESRNISVVTKDESAGFDNKLTLKASLKEYEKTLDEDDNTIADFRDLATSCIEDFEEKQK